MLSDGAGRLGVLTDVGTSTPHISAVLSGCDALVLECNHDVRMLAASRYPQSLKARIGGNHGHLNNEAAAEILASLDRSRLRHLVAAHLSQQNNSPELARAAMAGVLGAAADRSRGGLAGRRIRLAEPLSALIVMHRSCRVLLQRAERKRKRP